MNEFWDIILNTLINCSRVVCQNWNLRIVSFVFYPIKRKEDKNSNDPIFPGYRIFCDSETTRCMQSFDTIEAFIEKIKLRVFNVI